MFQRSYRIMLVYVRRWLNWLSLALLLSFFVMISFAWRDSSLRFGGPDVLASWKTIWTSEDLVEVLRDHPDEAVDVNYGISLGRVDASPLNRDGERDAAAVAAEAELFGKLRQLRHLEGLKATTSTITNNTLRHIGELRSLRRLVLGDSPRGEPYDLSLLSDLDQLEYLSLSGFEWKSASLAPLAQLPNLRVLRIEHVEPVTPEHLAEIAQIGSLRDLFLPDITKFQFSLEGLPELRSARQLRQVFVEISNDHREALAPVRERLPGVAVRCSMYAESRVNLTFMLCVVSLISMVVLSFTLVPQFSLPLAELAPGYKSAHQQFTWVMLGIMGVLGTLFLCVKGAQPLAAMGLLAICMLLPILGSVHHPGLGGTNSLHWSNFAAFPLTAILFLVFQQPLLFDEFLMGARPALTLAACGLGAFTAFDLYRGLNGICRRTSEAGTVPGDQAAMWKNIEKARERARALGKEPQFGRDPFDAMTGVTGYVFGPAMLAAVVAWRLQLIPVASDLVDKMLPPMIAILAFQMVFMTGLRWWQQVLFFPQQLLRPRTRTSHLNDLFQSVAWDFRKLLLSVLAVIVCLDARMRLVTNSPIASLLLSVLIVACLYFAGYSLMMWLLPIRSKLLVYCCGIGIVLLAQFVIIFGAFGRRDSSLPSQQNIILLAGGTMLLTAASLLLARRYYGRIEWGKIKE